MLDPAACVSVGGPSVDIAGLTDLHLVAGGTGTLRAVLLPNAAIGESAMARVLALKPYDPTSFSRSLAG